MGGGTVVTVPAVSLDTVVQRVGGRVDILKLDIEGAEHPVLARATLLDRVALVVGEYHPGAGASWETLRRSLDGLEVRPAVAADDKPRLFVALPAP
ncbi:MAG: FkbM family methyltransferase [Actinomycetota bacterium]|nr:FkbM family methyltransferase [Actinomycetota bacterium]